MTAQLNVLLDILLCPDLLPNSLLDVLLSAVLRRRDVGCTTASAVECLLSALLGVSLGVLLHPLRRLLSTVLLTVGHAVTIAAPFARECAGRHAAGRAIIPFTSSSEHRYAYCCSHCYYCCSVCYCVLRDVLLGVLLNLLIETRG